MKKIILTLMIVVTITTFSKAEELLYLSKKDAAKAAKFINKQTQLYLFCGCCTSSEKELITVVNAIVKEIDKKHCEVTLNYTNSNGEPKTKEVDLANLWLKEKKRSITVGQALDFEYDKCDVLGVVDWGKKKK